MKNVRQDKQELQDKINYCKYPVNPVKKKIILNHKKSCKSASKERESQC